MVNNVSNAKRIDTTNYSNTNDIKNTTVKNNSDTSTTSSQVSAQTLGTDVFVKSNDEDIKNLTYKPEKKKLTAEEVSALKEEQNNLKTDLIQNFINDTINTQNKILGKSTTDGVSSLPKESSDLLTKIFGSLEKAYPPIATNPEDAKAAISEGGEYSVGKVADRIMTMATALAGDDPDKLQKMRDAVEEGFSQAGLDFKNATKTDLPQICQDTYTEVMKRFDKLQKKGTNSDDKVQPDSN